MGAAVLAHVALNGRLLLDERSLTEQSNLAKRIYKLHFEFFFQVPYGDVMTKTLVFAVYDYDRFSKHDAIGEVRLPVCQMDLAQAKEIWKDLQSIVGDGKVRNGILLCGLVGWKEFTDPDIPQDI